MSELSNRKHALVIDVFGYRYVLVEDERYISTDPAAPSITRGPFYRQTDRATGKDLSPGRVFMPDEYYLRGQLAIPGSMYAIEDAPSPDDKKFREGVAERVAEELKAIRERAEAAKREEAAKQAAAAKLAVPVPPVEQAPAPEKPTAPEEPAKPVIVVKPPAK